MGEQTSKTFQVRICNKIDSLENWNNSTLILMEGELAIAVITYELNGETKESYVIKTGNGKDVFKNLKTIENYVAGDGINITENANNQKVINNSVPIKPLTQAEYDALTEEEKMSNVLYIITDGESEPLATVPNGAILAWYGKIADIPYGYVLCNGENGTPNLIGKFITGAGTDTDVQKAGNEIVGFVDDGAEGNLADEAQILSDDTISIYNQALYYIMKV